MPLIDVLGGRVYDSFLAVKICLCILAELDKIVTFHGVNINFLLNVLSRISKGL